VASPASHDYLRGLGASEVFDYRAADWVQQVRAAVPGGVDGGPAIFIVLQGPPAQLARRHHRRIVRRPRQPAAAGGTAPPDRGRHTMPRVEAVLPLDQAREALARVAGRHIHGKIVLRIGQ
jgi:NADPH2:quinone reductase